ncbi:peptide ABC transporter substrate-binding protein [Nibricoccus sp. IMCC34717]|uniref:peptide ABC transporter substrate-binding protein n=1 Tax=Nibricoccus sp. IMCC34717 TaxID=3034021 RepID=UPI0038513559
MNGWSILRAAGLLLALALATLTGTARETRAEQGVATQTLYFGIGPELPHLDPHLATEIGHYTVLAALLEGLVAEDPVDLHPVPGVAERWETTADATRWTFHLRANARWSNGEPVTAQDFADSWKRALAPQLAAEAVEPLYVLRNARAYHEGAVKEFSEVGIHVLDTRTLVLQLERPLADLPSHLNQCVFLPVHVRSIAAVGDPLSRQTPWARPGRFVGNGAFRLESWAGGQEIRASRSETYWDAGAVKLGAVHFTFFPDRDTEERAYRAGQLHITETLPPSRIEAWRRDRPAELRIDPYLGTEFYRLNLAHPLLGDARVRRALNLAIDRDVLVTRILRGGQQPAERFLPPGLGLPKPTAGVAYAPEEARRLLAEAGYPGGRGAPTLEILFNTSESHRALAEAVQAMWKKELGLNVRLVNQERIATLAARRTGNFQVMRSVWIADTTDPVSFIGIWRSGGPNNFTGFASARFDQALEAATREPSAEARLPSLLAAEQALLEELPLVVLYHYTHVFLVHPAVRGWHPTLLDRHPLKAVSLEKP